MAKSDADKIFNQMACIEAGIAYEDALSRLLTNKNTIDEWLACLPEAERTVAKRKFRKLWRKAAKKIYPKVVSFEKIYKSGKRHLAIQEARFIFDKKLKANESQVQCED